MKNLWGQPTKGLRESPRSVRVFYMKTTTGQSECAEATEYPVYTCQKRVEAFEVRKVLGLLLLPVNTDLDPVLVTRAWIDRFKPEAGGFWVRYENGNESWRPGEGFLGRYTPEEAI